MMPHTTRPETSEHLGAGSEGRQEPQGEAGEAPAEQGLPLPRYKTPGTTVLLVVLGLIFALQLITDALRMQVVIQGMGAYYVENVLVGYGAQIDGFIASGEYWRLFTSMFLHFGLQHFLLNAWALFSLGREVESFIGTRRFLIVYFLAGLFGSMFSYALVPLADWALTPSAGASGAIFGVVAADLAFFLLNHRGLGSLGRSQLGNLVVVIVINLAFGFAPGSHINNYAHLGGAVAGFVLGVGLSPRYEAVFNGPAPVLVDRRNRQIEMLAIAFIVFLLVAGVIFGDQRWSRGLPGLLSAIPAIKMTGRGV